MRVKDPSQKIIIKGMAKEIDVSPNEATWMLVEIGLIALKFSTLKAHKKIEFFQILRDDELHKKASEFINKMHEAGLELNFKK